MFLFVLRLKRQKVFNKLSNLDEQPFFGSRKLHTKINRLEMNYSSMNFKITLTYFFSRFLANQTTNSNAHSPHSNRS
jgi:hypothetical protein